MKIFSIARKDVFIRLRDRKGFILMLFMPILLTAILGAALSNVINDEASTMPKMTIAIYNRDEGEIGKRLQEDVLQSKDLRSHIIVKSFTNSDEVSSSVRSEKADVGIIIPQSFSQDVIGAKATSIEILQDPGKPVRAQIIRSIVSSFTDRVATVTFSSNQVIRDLAEAVPVTQPSIDINHIVKEVTEELKNAATATNVQVIEQPIGKKAVSGMQYYAAAMAAMFLLFNATVGAKLILNERSTYTLARLMNTPISKSSILLGKFFGTLVFSILQFLVFMSVTYILLGVSWGENYLQSIVIALFYSIAVSGLSMTIAATIGNEQAADVVSGIGVQILSALGGSMIPIALFPELLRKIAYLTPNTWALTSFTDIMTGTTWQALLLPISVLSAIGVISLMFGTWRLRLR